MALRFALSLGVLLLACGDSGSGGAAGATGIGGTGAGEAGGAPAMGGGGAATGGSTEGGGVPTTGGAGGEPALGGGPLSGYGEISGTCGEVDLEDLQSVLPALLSNEIDFSARPRFDVSLLSEGGQEMVADGNLGGSSLHSEVFALEVLERCEGATLLKTEGEIVYDTQSKKTDILVEIDGEKVGVSVVRAMSFPEGAAYTPADALPVLDRERLASGRLEQADSVGDRADARARCLHRGGLRDAR